ncbi:MAG: DUF933 domain-containing protein [Candidatus Omnitrophota bacterium]|nr:DUF933 domain-containing protein [Candidatus Omnitrophota bacterium]
MKISLFSTAGVNAGKHNVKDPRLDQVDKITQSKKKTYIQVELIAEADAADADAILALSSARTDLVLKDLEFVETRLSRSADEAEKALLIKLKNILEKEEFISNSEFSDAEKKFMGSWGLLTGKPVVLAEVAQLQDIDAFLTTVLAQSGYLSFFTTGEKETRAWLIKKGATAWEASGSIHSDIQKGFIRAEIIAFVDFIACGGEAKAKQAGKQRLEQKDYIMQDCDLANFRFNK